MLIANLLNLVKSHAYYFCGWVRASFQGVRLSSRARISPFADVRKAAFIGEAVIGRDVSIGQGTYINSGVIASGSIGEYCSIAYNVLIGPTEHKPDHWTTSPYEALASGYPPESTTRDVAPPVIENRVWIGANSLVLRGVRIGAGAILAAGSIATRDVPAGEIWGGVPAKFLRKRKMDQAGESSV